MKATVGRILKECAQTGENKDSDRDPRRDKKLGDPKQDKWVCF